METAQCAAAAWLRGNVASSNAAAPCKSLPSSPTTMTSGGVQSQALNEPGWSEVMGPVAAPPVAAPAAPPPLQPRGVDCAACGRLPGLRVLPAVAAGHAGAPVLAAGVPAGRAAGCAMCVLDAPGAGGTAYVTHLGEGAAAREWGERR